ncbi:MAG: 4Fe-4S dicluster domain-containing protein [Chloroflexi bacterium]|nr:4Fe-4S dicluster domain-containing protein [Chloroflexota bacterium]
MTRWGMVIDLDKCTACQACSVACKTENNVPFGTQEQWAQERAPAWQRVLGVVESVNGKMQAHFYPRPCMHCENPPCVLVCPVQATYKDEEGIVQQDYQRCIGCRYCMAACPYGVRVFNWKRPSVEETHANYLNPAPLTRPRPVGVVEKCTFCVQRIQRAKAKAVAEERSLRDGDIVTACQQTCPASAIYFGDLEDSNSQVSQLARSRRAFRLLEELGTRPQVYYLSEG